MTSRSRCEHKYLSYFVHPTVRLSTRLIRSEYTSERLRRKLGRCGTYTCDGIQGWCRSPACDRCRRYRARWIAEGVADWTGEIVATHRVMMIGCSTPAYAEPNDVLDAVDATRRAMRRAYDYRQSRHDRWSEVQQYACWMPRWDGTMWSASLRGVIYLGGVSEARYLEEIGGGYGVWLQPFARDVIRVDVRDHVYRAMTIMTGASDCDDHGVARMMSEIDHRGGYKPLLFRRGMQDKR